MRAASVSIKKGEITYRGDLTRYAIISRKDSGTCNRL